MRSTSHCGLFPLRQSTSCVGSDGEASVVSFTVLGCPSPCFPLPLLAAVASALLGMLNVDLLGCFVVTLDHCQLQLQCKNIS
jgi:hypothetical protein